MCKVNAPPENVEDSVLGLLKHESGVLRVKFVASTAGGLVWLRVTVNCMVTGTLGDTPIPVNVAVQVPLMVPGLPLPPPQETSSRQSADRTVTRISLIRNLGHLVTRWIAGFQGTIALIRNTKALTLLQSCP